MGSALATIWVRLFLWSPSVNHSSVLVPRGDRISGHTKQTILSTIEASAQLCFQLHAREACVCAVDHELMHEQRCSLLHSRQHTPTSIP